MEVTLYDLKKIMFNLEKENQNMKKEGLLEELIETAEKMKKQLTQEKEKQKQHQSKTRNIKMEKISQEEFLYRPILVRDYYEGDYLERFGEIRTSDLKNINLLSIHNEFWKAHEVQKGNVFASMPKELMSTVQSNKLEYLGWLPVEVDVYEILHSESNKKELMQFIESEFSHYILIKEIYGNILMLLHYKTRLNSEG
ncbi:hypothetical protein Amet_3179 [Alkaliphilus metalliredigens QYMF]|uniref:Uncharacterized protein n=1 Tax=Alkaliphilus metalliredigens (strain QYMF) TaxID=293826 RepID=A6TSZ9_ALKMQ|nr:hypothetical protein [Alkaliphilus metalliredigens]ABR49317.1 hypothetical protein Amet_3179 [Alkaliphilus metalliredigens QYMF]